MVSGTGVKGCGVGGSSWSILRSERLTMVYGTGVKDCTQHRDERKLAARATRHTYIRALGGLPAIQQEKCRPPPLRSPTCMRGCFLIV